MNGMSKIVRTMARLLYPFVLAFGAYIVMHGHLTPGGGFQGGAVIASGLAMMVVAFGRRSEKHVREGVLSVIEDFGALAFLGLAFLGIGTTFFYNLIANSGWLFGSSVSYGSNPGYLNTGGTLPYMNWAVGLKVLAGLGSIVVLMAFVFGEDEDEDTA